MKYTIELKNNRERDNLIELMSRGIAFSAEHYGRYRAMENIERNIKMQLANKHLISKDKQKPETIEEMRKTCKQVWGWQYNDKDWDDEMVKKYYKLWKAGFFDLK